MFEWLKGRSNRQQQEDLERRLKAITDQSIEVCKRTWADLHPTPNASMPSEQLAREIEEFAQSAFRFMFAQFPIMKEAPPFHLWLVVFTAVLETKTLPTDNVNAAIDLLRAKYGPIA